MDTVGAVGLGCMPLTMSYGASHRRQAGPVIDAALDQGVTHFDTADMYGSGANEQVVGRSLGARREGITLASKVGIRAFAGIPHGVNGRPAYIRQAVERTLRRLRTDHLDLYYLHRVDPATPIEDSIGAMAELVAQGKVRQLGVSEVTGEQLRRAHSVHPIAAVQMEWSLFERRVEADTLPAARALGVSIVAYAPLGRGMLTGSAGATTNLGVFDIRRTLPRWKKDALPRYLTAVAAVRTLAVELEATPGQVALAWLLHQGADVIPIPGTTSPTHLTQNVHAARLALTPEQLARLTGAAALAAGTASSPDDPTNQDTTIAPT